MSRPCLCKAPMECTKYHNQKYVPPTYAGRVARGVSLGHYFIRIESRVRQGKKKSMLPLSLSHTDTHTHKRNSFFYSSTHKNLPHHHHLHTTTHTPLRSVCNMADTEISPQVTYEELAAIEMDFEDIDNQISTFCPLSIPTYLILTVTNN